MVRHVGFSSLVVLLALLLVGCPESPGASDAGDVPDAGGGVDAGAEPGPPAWRWENPTPSGWGVLAMWGRAVDDVFAVGFYGNVLHWDGRKWSEQYVGATGDYEGIWGSGPNDVWVVGDDKGHVLHFDGESWEPFAHPGNLPLNAITGFAADDVWAVGGRYNNGAFAGIVMHYDGTAWTVVNDQWATTFRAIWGTGPEDLYLGGDNGILLHYDGDEFTPILGISGQVRAITGLGPQDDVLVLTENALFQHTRGSTSLTELKVFTQPRGIWAKSMTDLFVASGEGVSHFDGEDWTSALTLPAAGQALVRTFWGTGDTLFVGGDGVGGWDSAGLWRKDASGWHTDGQVLTPEEFRDVFAVSPTRAFAVGDDGTLAGWDGTAWSLIDPGATSRLEGVWANETELVISTGIGELKRRNGVGWSTFVVQGEPRLGQVRGRAVDDLYVVGIDYNNPGLYHFDGAALTPVVLPTNLASILELWTDPVTGAPVVSGRTNDDTTGVFSFDPLGTTWVQLASPALKTASNLAGTSLDDLYVAERSQVFHWDGSAWAGVFDCEETGYFTGIWARAADDVWAVGYDSVIAHFDGTAWSVVQQRASGWELYAVHGSAADDVVVVGESGHLLRFAPTPPVD